MRKTSATLRIGLIAAATCALGSTAAAAPDCDAAEDQATMNQCADLDYQASDAKLNRAYKAIMARLADLPDAKASLLSAQRAWIKYRDAECQFEASAVSGGSVYPMILSGCLAGVTEARVSVLEGFLACDETDLSCPVPSE